MAEHTSTPWYVRDFRAAEMKRLGWTGPAIDRILITNATGPEIEASSGANSVIARIQFDNREEFLTDGNLADAAFIVKAVNSHAELVDLLRIIARGVEIGQSGGLHYLSRDDVMTKARNYCDDNKLTYAVKDLRVEERVGFLKVGETR